RNPDLRGGLGVHDELDLAGLQDRQFTRFLPAEDPPGIDPGSAILLGDCRAVAHQAAGRHETAVVKDRREFLASCETGDLLAPGKEIRIRGDYQRGTRPLCALGERAGNLTLVAGFDSPQRAAAPPAATIAATFFWTRAAAMAGSWSYLPAAQAYSIATFSPSL